MNDRSRFAGARTPPYSLDAEQAVLGALMLSDEAYFKISDKVSSEDFYRQDHRTIFQAISALKEKGQPCDAVTLGEWLERNELAESAGGIAYVIELANNTPGSANIVAYAEIVREKAIMRQLMEAGTEIVDGVLAPEGRGSEELLQSAEKLVFDIGERGKRGRGTFVPVSEALKEAYRTIEHRYSNKGTLSGLDTGFVDLNQMTNGLQPGDLVIVAARPSMGKTSFAMNIAEHAAIQSGQPVAIFSMEMPTAQLALRMISSLGRIDQRRLRNGDLADEDWPRVTSAITLLTGARIFIDDTAGLSPSELRARTRRLKREHGLGLIVIDYMQLMQVPGTRENRATEISEISRNLKAIAKEMNVPVIALSQLNRSLEQRNDKRPIMADLRECVTGDTLVVLSDGRRIPVASLVGKKPRVMCIDAERTIGSARAEEVYAVGKQPTLVIATDAGVTLRASAGHRVLTAEGWSTAGELQIGNRLAFCRQSLHAWNCEFAHITGIAKGGVETVYDLSVPGPENWLADGIVCHNSGAIEQDADLICFIYRDEYYHQDSAKKGIAEIIIAKHRNGPTGSLDLWFRGQFTRFDSIARESAFD